MEEIKAIETRLSQLQALSATKKAAGKADLCQVNVLLESLARLEHDHAQYKGATPNEAVPRTYGPWPGGL